MPPLKYAAPIKNLDVLKGTSIIYAWGEIEIFRGMVFHPRYGTRGTRFFHQPIREDVFSRHFFQKVPKSPGTFFSCFICVKIVWKEIKRKHYKQVGMWNFGILQNLCLRWGRGPGDQRFVGSLVFLSPSADRRAIILSPPDRGTGVGSISFSCLGGSKVHKVWFIIYNSGKNS